MLALVRATAGSAEDIRGRLPGIDPATLMALMQRTRMLVTFGPQLAADHGEALPEWFSQQAVASRALARRQGLLQEGLIARLSGALDKRGVRMMPLKGAGFAEDAYGDLGARSSADIDLLVRREQLDDAVALVTELGWQEQRLSMPASGLPRLHRVLEHPSLPPVELHWRVHWYEDEYSERALERARPGEQGRLRPLHADQMAFLLLFLARDGFAGLRRIVDIAAWWHAVGQARDNGGGLTEITAAHPALEPSLAAAAVAAERLIALPPGSLMTPARPLGAAQRMAIRLANPWLEGDSQQINAEVSLIDGLLGPSGGTMAFARRRLMPPAHEALLRQPELEHAGRSRVLAARLGHAVRVVARYLLAARRVVRRPPVDGGEWMRRTSTTVRPPRPRVVVPARHRPSAGGEEASPDTTVGVLLASGDPDAPAYST